LAEKNCGEKIGGKLAKKSAEIIGGKIRVFLQTQRYDIFFEKNKH
jgi:hypothetical protein